MPGIARFNDIVVGSCSSHGSQVGIIITASGNVNANSIGIARNSDIVQAGCGDIGIISTSSVTVKSNGMGIARNSDQVIGVFSGTIVMASPNVNAG